VVRSLLVTVVIAVASFSDAASQVLTLPLDQRPKWLRDEGMIMAGSWEPLTYRTRQGTLNGHAPTDEEWATWEYEHSADVTQKMKDLGVNFVMMHCYKGAGMEVEKRTMEDAARFAKQYHDAGLHVGVYAFSGAFLWEPLYRERREAQNWAILEKDYKPIDYYNLGIRYYWNRNHPEAQAYYKKIVDFAVNEIHTDLLHFDNYSKGPGRDANSTDRFREYLRKNFTAEQREKMGAADLSLVIPPMNERPENMLDYAWLKFRSESLAASYKDMGQYARSMKKDILLELNCGAPAGRIRTIDHGLQLQGGEALWSEGRPSGFADGKYSTRIVSYKIARSMDNMVFFYANTPVSMAESMAFNSDCLGMVCGFEDGKIVSPGPGKEFKIEEVVPYIKFYKNRRTLFRDAKVISDIAVLRSFPSQVFSDPENAHLTSKVEQYCIDERVPFQIVYDAQLANLEGYRVLALAGCVALSNDQVQQILKFVDRGGRLCVIGPVATYNEWMVSRSGDVFDNVASDRIVRVDADGDIGKALLQSLDGQYAASVTARKGLFAEYTSVTGQLLVHLVNFRPEEPVKNVSVNMIVPKGKKVSRVSIASPDEKADRTIKFSKKGNAISFTVPEVSTYSVAIVELK
jgi:hypothetical protein